jgi:LysR family transcriptional regulator, hydrogen peroxide-inducible genes activator
MEMHQVRYFLAVAKELNFTRAAEKCNVSQPSLSRAIQQLEGELGGPLLRRERHVTCLTDLGEMVRPHLETVYEAAVEAKRLSREVRQRKTVCLKLGIMSSISPHEIVDLVAALKSSYDGFELRLWNATAHELRERLLAGDLDAVFYALPDKESDKRIHVVPLFAEPLVIIVHRGHLLATRHAISLRELDGERYIRRMNWEFAGYSDRTLKEIGVTCAPAHWSERDDWTLAMVAAGLGYAFMPQNAAHHPGVVALPLIEPQVWRNVNLATLSTQTNAAGVSVLLREATRKKWFGIDSTAPRLAEPAP